MLNNKVLKESWRAVLEILMGRGIEGEERGGRGKPRVKKILINSRATKGGKARFKKKISSWAPEQL